KYRGETIKPATSAVGTKVKTKKGVVIVSGNARNAAEKDLVTKFAGDVNGVKTVRYSEYPSSIWRSGSAECPDLISSSQIAAGGW
ncbi:MAG: BON protein, partial [Actinobacteria bacterium]|nr:BON protein [Actinomycetota bacterium]